MPARLALAGALETCLFRHIGDVSQPGWYVVPQLRGHTRKTLDTGVGPKVQTSAETLGAR